MDTKELSLLKDEEAIRRQYTKLKKVLVKNNCTKEEKDIVHKAFKLASYAHKNIYRCSGESYVIHSLRVAQIIVEELGLDITSVLSGLLHDVPEDTSISINKIKELFGLEVAKIVHGVTKIKRVSSWDNSEQAENLKKLLLSLKNNHRVILVKIADRLDNMRTLSSLSRRRQLKTASETIQFYVPIAHRLGLNKIKLELEDLYLKYVYPKIYDNIKEQLDATKKGRQKVINKFAEPIEKELKKNKVKFILKKRIKSIYSIWKKMIKNHVEMSEIYDLIALRIILDCPIKEEKALCWKVLGIVTEFYTPNPSRFKDWISTPKSNGYESLHTTLMNTNGQWVEIQIRTERMHKTSCKGLAAHWQYKKEKNLISFSALTNWIKDVQKILKEPKRPVIEAIEDVRISLYDDEINVFNQKGQAKILPKGATVLDFAIEETNKEGLKSSGALVNQKIVPLSQILSNGDQVEIIINSSQTPDLSWLNFVVTAKSRRIIKEHFKGTYEAIQLKGENIIKDILREFGLILNKTKSILLKEFFDERTMSTLYSKVANQTITTKQLKSFSYFVKSTKVKISQTGKKTLEDYIKKSTKKLDIVVKEEKQHYNLGKCCDPIPGEEIFGVITNLQQNTKIHRIDCTNALYILTHESNKVIEASWGEKKRGSFINLTLKALSQTAIQEKILHTLQTECYIESIIFKKLKDFEKYNLIIEVKNTEQLNKITNQLHQIQGVVDVTRHPSGQPQSAT